MSATPEQLRQAVAAIDTDLAQVESDYQALVEKLASGDKHALAKADQLDQRRSVLIRNKAMSIAACGLLQQQLEAEQAAAAEAEKRKQRIAAGQIADQVASLHVDLDRQLLALREQLERRAVLLRQLANSGEGNSAWLNKLLTKPAATRAACAAGLHKFIALETVATPSFTSFTSANAVLLAIGRDDQAGEADNGDNGIARRRLNGE
jgi:hypothetical protein